MKSLTIGLLGSLLFIGSTTAYAFDSQWELEKEKKGVKVYTREKADSPLKEFKGIITISTTPHILMATLRDVANYQQWMPDVEKTKLITQTDNSQLHYLQSDLPWPVVDRDGAYSFKYTLEKNGAVRVDVAAEPTAVEPEKGYIRIPYVSGYWLFQPATKTTTEVTYQMHADPGGSIPKWLINSSVVDTPYQTLLNLKAHVEK